MVEEIIEVLVEGGKASAGPPIGPALGPHGLNVVEVVNEINKLTKDFQGMKVPVKITIDPATKEFELRIGTPPASALIMEKASLEKGEIKNVTRDMEFSAESYPQFMADLIRVGGLVEYTKKRLANRRI